MKLIKQFLKERLLELEVSTLYGSRFKVKLVDLITDHLVHYKVSGKVYYIQHSIYDGLDIVEDTLRIYFIQSFRKGRLFQPNPVIITL